jgi:GNAT superfamily N-acetyltransferase
MLEPNEHFVYKKPGGVMLEYYNKKDKKIGYIRYYITTGQIGLFFIDKEYQNRGLGKQILSKVIQEMKDNQCDEVWAVATDHHPFWSNVYNKSFLPGKPAHPSVTGSGYFMKLYTNERMI